MSTPAEWTGEELAIKLEERLRSRKAAAPEPAGERQELRKAAALLTSFDPEALGATADVDAAAARLIEDCSPRGGRPKVVWALRPDVRRAALASFDGPDEARRMLESTIGAAVPGGSEDMALAYLRGEPPDLEELDSDGLVHVREALSWLRQVPGVEGLPDADRVQRLLDRRRLVDPLRSLVRHGFEGRARELDALRGYVGVLHARTWRGKVAGAGRSVQGLFGRQPVRLPLVITGPGGIGKSTLVARFLLEHVDVPGSRFPFAFVDFESATLRIQEPVVLVAEMARQLAAQYPDHAAELRRLRSRARAQARAQRQVQEELGDLREIATSRAALGRAADHRFHVKAREDDARAARSLGELLRRAVGAGEPTFLIVLDSFEEAQYRASPILDRMWAMFRALTDAYPHTRVVVAGRAPVGHPDVPAEDVPTLPLGELDPAAAQHLLQSRGVREPVARALAARIGGNPLSLQLAAEVALRMQEGGDDGSWVRTVPAKRRRLFGAVDDMLIQGVLYDRLLKHIGNDDVRRLAHPGLVLRRVTPGVIQHVLGPACGVDVPDTDRARELFDDLARELDLVERVAPDVLRHRPDVRRVMLRLLADDAAATTAAVERAAIRYYAASDDPADRAEELYHRLRLGENLSQVEARWTARAGALLDGVDAELPARSVRVLTRLRADAVGDAAAEDERRAREQGTADEADNLLTQGFAESALAVLEQRRPWTTGSRLYPIRAEALLRLGRVNEARSTVADALDEPGVELHGDTHLELLLLSARIAMLTGDAESADHDLALAERTAAKLGRELDALGAALNRARLRSRRRSQPADEDVDADLARRVEALPEKVLAGHPALFRAVAAEVGRRAPRVLARALEIVGLPGHSRQSIAMFARAIAESAAERPVVAEVMSRLAGSDVTGWRAADPADIEGVLELAARDGKLDEVARELLTVRDDSGSLRAAIAAAMAAEITGPDDEDGRDDRVPGT